MTIRPLTEADLPRVINLEAACFSDPWTAGMFRAELENPACRYYAAETAGRLVGYAGMQTVLDEGYLNNLAVDPALRRQGVATALLRHLFQEAAAASLSLITLEVRAGNASAIALYAKNGFQPVGLRRGYYTRPPEDALLMTKTFTKEP